MHPAHRLTPCAALLLAAAAPLAHALDANVNPDRKPGHYAAAIESASAPDPLSARVAASAGRRSLVLNLTRRF